MIVERSRKGDRVSRRSRERRTKHSRAGRIVLGVIAILLVGTLVMTSAGVAVAFGVAGSWLEDLPDVNDPSAFQVAQTTKVYSADGVLLASLYLENREIVSIDRISPHVLHAVVAVEDERFYEHDGVDLPGIIRAFVTNITTNRHEGASTLTQQYIRNTILSEERYDITYRRKVREAYLAYQLEKKYSKDEILAMYINTVYYGEGAHGIEAAALTYFNKHADELTVAEAALLAGLPQSPSTLSPYDNPEGAVSRRQWVLKKMFEQGYITSEEYEAAKVEDLALGRSETLDDQGVYSAPYFVSYVKKFLQDKYGTSLVFQGGLTVYTTLDTRLQTFAENAVTGVLDRADDPDCALVSIDPSTGYIKALVGGRDWSTTKFNFATQAKRQPGSSFKVFTLVTALEQGMPPHRRIDSSAPAIIQTGSGTPWKVNNAEGGGRGYITLQAATTGSVNTAFARLIAELGASPVIETAHRMGITSNLQPYLSLTLGSQEVTPLEMASAFGTLAANGIHNPPVAVTKVIDSAGTTIYEATSQGTQALTPNIAYAATSILKGVISGGTGTRAAIGRPAAGKTGTTQDYRDAWFVGYTPQLSTSVWMGYTPEKPMRNVHGRRVYGGTFPAMIWHDFMAAALADQPKLDFTKAPAPKYTWKKEWDPIATVPSLVGLTEEKAIEALKKAGVSSYAFTSQYNPTVPAGMVISQDPAPDTRINPEKDSVTVVLSKGREPEPEPPPTPEPTSTPDARPSSPRGE